MTDPRLDMAFEHRDHLLNVAYRMLGSLADAEDAVQEAYAKLLRSDLDIIEDVRGWLVVVVGRVCLDVLRSARVRRESYIGPWLPEPAAVTTGANIADPADRITLDDSVRMALLVTLERLSPAERAAFVLHDVFQLSFDEVSAIVGRAPEACRQLASRARKHVRSSARFHVDSGELEQLTTRFIAAATHGDLDGLKAVLAPDVSGWTDSGGRPGAPRTTTTGQTAVAERLLWFLRAQHAVLAAAQVNGEPGAVALSDGRLIGVIAFETTSGLITRIHAVANPDKLAAVAATLGLPT